MIQLVESLRDGQSIPERAAFRALAEHRWSEWFRGHDDLDYFDQHFEVLEPVEIDGLLLQQDGERLYAWQPRAAVLEIASMWKRHQRVHPEGCSTPGCEDDTWASWAVKFGNLIAFRKSEAIRAGFWPAGDSSGAASACSVPVPRTLEQVMDTQPQRFKHPDRKRSQFTDEFKRWAVTEVYEPFFAGKKKGVDDAATRLGLVERTLRKWIAAYGKEGGGVSADQVNWAEVFAQLNR